MKWTQEQAQVAAKPQDEPWAAVELQDRLQARAELQEAKEGGIAK